MDVYGTRRQGFEAEDSIRSGSVLGGELCWRQERISSGFSGKADVCSRACKVGKMSVVVGCYTE